MAKFMHLFILISFLASQLLSPEFAFATKDKNPSLNSNLAPHSNFELAPSKKPSNRLANFLELLKPKFLFQPPIPVLIIRTKMVFLIFFMMVTIVAVSLGERPGPELPIQDTSISANNAIMDLQRHWRGSGSDFRMMIPRLKHYFRYFPFAFRIFSVVEIRNPNVVWNYFGRIEQIEAIPDNATKLMAIRDFQAASYVLYLLTRNLTLSEQKAGDLFANFSNVLPPKNVDDDVYSEWIQEELVPAVRENLVAWNVPVPSFVTDQEGELTSKRTLGMEVRSKSDS